MRNPAIVMVMIVIISVLLAGLTGCDTCDVCGTYYGQQQVAGSVDYIKIHSDGTCEGSWFVGTWELHEEKINGMSLKTLVITAPIFGAMTYRVMENMLISPNGERYRKAD